MLVTVLILSPFGLALAVLALPASRRSRVNAAGGPAVPPQARRTVRGAAVPVITDCGPAAGRQPYDSSGVITGEADEPWA